MARGEDIFWGDLADFQGWIALPINVGLQGLHWTFALLPPPTESTQVIYVDPLGGTPHSYERKVIELVRTRPPHLHSSS
jgi:hypothetical protein